MFIRDQHFKTINKALKALEYSPSMEADLKQPWHINLTDAKFGHVLIRSCENKVGIESFSDGMHLHK